jgi:putative N6-adenine-specific DNA methylase
VDALEGHPGGVSFSGPLDTVYHANLNLRTAHRVLMRLGEGLAQNLPMLYERARKVPWELVLGFAATYSVHVSAKSSRLMHRKQLASTLADAVHARLEPLGLTPRLAEDAALELHLRLFQDRATLSFNTSGEHLHKRGYRQATAKAPLRETLAAAVLLASDANRFDLILDPMCGAGTLIVEAALIARNLAPGRHRAFAFEQAAFFQPSKWERLRRERESATLASSPVTLVANDWNAGGLDAAGANAERAGVIDDITFTRGDALELDLAAMPEGRRFLVANLPYGRRIGDERRARALHVKLARKLASEAQGWHYALLTAHPEWLVEAGLRPGERLEFRHGGLGVTLLRGSA